MSLPGTSVLIIPVTEKTAGMREKKTRFLLLRQGLFWLSETPGIPSRGWDAALNRICVYGLFESLNTRHRFIVFNTHLDHIGVLAREKSIELILEKTDALN